MDGWKTNCSVNVSQQMFGEFFYLPIQSVLSLYKSIKCKIQPEQWFPGVSHPGVN